MQDLRQDERRETVVWDVATRVFHWSLVTLVAINLFFISPEGGVANVIHFVAGFAIAGLLVFRLAWGFIGSPRSRFADFVRRWPTVRDYVARLRRLAPPHSVGHNPLGGWMIIVLLSTLSVMVLTGLFAASRHAAGPLAHLLPAALAGTVGAIHSLFANILILLIVAHVAGVVVDWLLTRDNLVRAMFTGRKKLAPDEAAAEPKVAPAWRAAVIGLIALIVAGVLAVNTDYSANRASLQQTSTVVK